MNKKIIYLWLVIVLALPLLAAASVQRLEAAAMPDNQLDAAPGNDDLINATPVLAFPYSDTIADTATLETDEIICGNQQSGSDFNASAWYIYTPDQDGVLDATVTPNSDLIDLSLGLYTGSGHPLTELVCRDNNGDGQVESLIAAVTAGTTYYIRVAPRGDFGDYQVRMLDETFIYLPITLKNFPPSDWQEQNSGVFSQLNGIDCASTSNCVAVGDNGEVLTTEDGGTTWNSQNSGVTNDLNDVSCRNSDNCVAVGDGGLIITTSNGGDTWSSKNSGSGQNLRGVSCATDTCLAVGGSGTSTGVVSNNGGDSWTALPALGNTPLYGVSCPNDGTCTLVGDGGRVLVIAGLGVKALFNSLNPNRFESVDCPTDQICVIAGLGGVIYTSSNGGSSWTSRVSGIGNNLEGVSCPSAQVCYAAGDGGVVIMSNDSGISWAAEDTGDVTTNLNDISCPGLTTCFAVGNNGIILGRK